MLPTTTNGPGKRNSAQRVVFTMSTYLRRLIRPRQMDFEYTFWLMLQMYRHTAYHKQTKNQWARDDPAYVIICCLLVATAALAYCATYGHELWHSLATVLSAVLVDFLLVGCGIATAGWFLANRFLRRRSHHSHAIEQHVEWMYAFDVHCNSYFPLFLLLYVCQFLVAPVLLWRNLLSTVLSNALYAAAFSYYHYLSFLGYSALPFLEHTEIFLWPVALIVVLMPLCILSGFNPTRFTLSIYFD